MMLLHAVVPSQKHPEDSTTFDFCTGLYSLKAKKKKQIWGVVLLNCLRTGCYHTQCLLIASVAFTASFLLKHAFCQAASSFHLLRQ